MNLRLFTCLRGERGMALVLTLGVMTVLSAAAIVVIDFSSSSARGSGRSNDDRMALALAEAGINNALAVIGNAPTNNPTTTTLLPLRTTTYSEGSVDWSGAYTASTGMWKITAIGKVRNTTAEPTRLVEKKLVADVQLKWAPMQAQQHNAWDYVFVTNTANTCDLTMPNAFTWNSALYVMGDLCVNNGAKITGGPLVVRQSIDLATSTSAIGSSGARISRVDVGVGASGSCQWAAQHWHPNADGHVFCSSSDNVWATTLTNSPPAYTAPVPEWDTWYNNAMPGPKTNCTSTSGTVPVFDNDTTRNNSVASTFNIMPNTASYSCKVGSPSSPIGEITWNLATKTLTVRGTIFIDGPIIANAGTGFGAVQIVGPGTIYASGTFTLANEGILCSSIVSNDCNWGGWNPSTDMLSIVAGCTGGVKNSVGQGAHFQGAVYSGCAFELAANAKMEGPVVAPSLMLGSGASSDPWNQVDAVTAGMPGNTPVYAGVNQPSYE